jgi:hypothetical protein
VSPWELAKGSRLGLATALGRASVSEWVAAELRSGAAWLSLQEVARKRLPALLRE